MEAKIIRTAEQYEDYLQRVHELIVSNPAPGSPEAEQLELLTVLIEAYEKQKFPIESPDPIDAITFRMEERGLRKADLIPYFGTSSRVSEVLGRKRPLTVQMIRAISIGLGISADTLVGLSLPDSPAPKADVDWKQFPAKEMQQRGWLSDLRSSSKEGVEEVVRSFISSAGLQLGTAAFRRSIFGEAQSPSTRYALYAWLARIILRARTKKPTLGKFDAQALSPDFLKHVVQYSWSDAGPLVAVEFLEKHGIAVVIEPHLKGTHLDGAALRDVDGTPIIGLTLRHDRIDNFWFTLLHELAHIWKHISRAETFLDDVDASSEDRREAEANRIARETAIPRLLWKRSRAFITPSDESIEELARELKIHPAIIAGRLRRDTGNYQLFTKMLGQGHIQPLFSQSMASSEA
jgi:HTH-type transcriptional regulator/antitoxin HigA